MTSNLQLTTEGMPSLATPYAPKPDVFDEMKTPDGTVRAHWRRLLNGIEQMGAQEIDSRWDTAARLIVEHGITYNVHGDPEGLDRPWQLDPLPLVIEPGEWQQIETGLIQRASLLEKLIEDVYGRQSLIRDGRLPASIIFPNPRFLRAVHGFTPPGGTYVHFFAFDIGRSPDGRWWVLNDRTQAPSGAGYAIENRIVTSRVLPEIVRDTGVQRLAPFFHEYREFLRSMTGNDEPRVVLLTPGPYNETYFEHVYLARYLGMTLVEGADLTVRDNKVYMKTLSGLRQVDVILRRLDDDFCDPLELREESSLGIPGLVQAWRAGNVVIANGLGAGVVESQSIMGFLPGLCRYFQDEGLILPNVATWWCGQEDAKAFVLANFENLIIKPAFFGNGIDQGSDGLTAGQLTMDRQRELRSKIESRGYAYIGQEPVTLSTTPIMTEQGLEPAAMVTRMYVARGRDGYTVMPGGLTRVSSRNEALSVSMQMGDGSKDTWVVSDGPVMPFSLLKSADAPLAIRRTGADLPSRAADNLFWLGRYIERAEGVMRLLRALLSRLTDDLGLPADSPQLQALLQVLIEEDQVPEDPDDDEGDDSDATAPTLHRSFDARYAQGLQSTLAGLENAAAATRDRLSLDAWSVVNRLTRGRDMLETRIERSPSSALTRMDEMIALTAAFSGMEMENMTRGFGWTFLDIGKRIERAIHTATMLNVMLRSKDPENDGTLDLLLELADSFMTYRSRYLITPQLAPVVDLLLLDETNPRSVLFQLAALDEHFAGLPRSDVKPGISEEQKVVRELTTTLQLADVHALCERDQKDGLPALTAVLERILRRLPNVSDIIGSTYFVHLELVHIERPYRMGPCGAAPQDIFMPKPKGLP